MERSPRSLASSCSSHRSIKGIKALLRLYQGSIKGIKVAALFGELLLIPQVL
jgi:hypothetical protein